MPPRHCRRSERRPLTLPFLPAFVAAGAAAVVLGASGCTPAVPVSPDPAPGGQASAPSPAKLLESLAARDTALGSFQAQGKLHYEGPGGKVRSANMIVVKAPDKVRIDFRSPFSLTYTVVTDGSELVAYDRGEKIMYVGEPTIDNIGRYTRVPASVETLARLVRGMPPLPPGPARGEVLSSGEDWLWRVPLEDGSVLELLFGADGLHPKRATLGREQTPDFTAFFEGYRDVAGVAVPHEIRADLPDGGRVQLTYSVVWRDRMHDDNAFRLEPPAGVRVVEMDE